MSSKTLFFALALSALLGGPALAKDEAGAAKLTAPVAEKVRVVADHAVWVCQADGCVTVMADRATVRGCKDLARKVGPLASYGRVASPLSEEALAACNVDAAPAPRQSASAN